MSTATAAADYVWQIITGDPDRLRLFLVIYVVGAVLLLAVAVRAHRQGRREARRAERETFSTDPLESPS